MNTKESMIFAGSSGKGFAQRVCDYIGVPLGKSQVIKFSEGNTMVRILEPIRNKEVFFFQPIGMNPNDEFVEILFFMDAFKRASAQSVTAIIPYFSYAKGDKKDEPRVSIRARVCAECLELAGADRVVTMDLHSAQVQGFFKKPVDHLYAMPILTEYVRSLAIDNAVIVSPDSGYAKQARKFASHLGLPVAIGDKTRYGHDEKAEVLDVVGEVKDKNCVIVDDFTISGGTLVSLAVELKRRGAERIIACLSHNIISEEGVKKLEASPIDTIISTDTVENPHIAGHKKFKTITVAPLFAEAVMRTHDRESLSPLFEQASERILKSVFEYDKE
ncbi:ribose-phosphate diphosphokinase [Gehongia tenuis]|nr:ribose-phosphate diphosphokinase [Gehongia tenuis]